MPGICAPLFGAKISKVKKLIGFLKQLYLQQRKWLLKTEDVGAQFGLQVDIDQSYLI